MRGHAAGYDVSTMIRRRINLGVIAIVVVALIVWFATGRAIYTRFPDARRTALAPLQQQDENLWPEGSVEASTGQTEEFPNRFMLGLLPSGGGKYLLSVSAALLPTLCIWAVCHTVRQIDRSKR